MRPHPRRAETDPTKPRAWATCDRCGFVTNHFKLSWQFDWAGLTTVNKRVLVCDDCLDTPQRQLGTIIPPPDPMPIMNARPERYDIDEYPVTTLAVENGAVLAVSETPYPIELIVNVAGNLPSS